MAYTPYTGPVVDPTGQHYHNWFLAAATVPGMDGTPTDGMALLPAMRPYADRTTAHRHAKQFGAPFRVMKCRGGNECPAANPHGEGLRAEKVGPQS